MCLQRGSLPSFHSPPTRAAAWCRWRRPSGPGTHSQHLHALIKVIPAPQHLPPRTDAAALRREIDGARSRRSSGRRASAAREAGRRAVCSEAVFKPPPSRFFSRPKQKPELWRPSGCFRRRELAVGMCVGRAGGVLTYERCRGRFSERSPESDGGHKS